jgi:hypothetical protein
MPEEQDQEKRTSLGKRTGPTTAEKKATRTKTQEKFAEQYDADPSSLVATRALRSIDPAAHVGGAAGHDINLGTAVFGPFTAYIEFQTKHEPTVRQLVVQQEKRLAQANRADVAAMQKAALEQFKKKSPFDMETPELTAPLEELELDRLRALSKGITSAKEFTLGEGTRAMRQPKIAGILTKAWAANTNPEISEDTTLKRARELEGAADSAAFIIEKLYTLHLGSLNNQDSKLLVKYFSERPREMPTLDLVHETTQAHRIANEKAEIERAEFKAEERAKREAEIAAASAYRNRNREPQEVTTDA